MNQSAKRQHHEQSRKKHRQEQKQLAREAARRQRDSFPRWLLIAGIALMVLFVFGIAFMG